MKSKKLFLNCLVIIVMILEASPTMATDSDDFCMDLNESLEDPWLPAQTNSAPQSNCDRSISDLLVYQNGNTPITRRIMTKKIACPACGKPCKDKDDLKKHENYRHMKKGHRKKM